MMAAMVVRGRSLPPIWPWTPRFWPEWKTRWGIGIGRQGDVLRLRCGVGGDAGQVAILQGAIRKTARKLLVDPDTVDPLR